MKKTYSFLSMLLFASAAFSQNWQYLGGSNFYINQTTGTTSMNIPEMEINSAGDVFVGYNVGNFDPREMKLAKFSGGSWTQLPSPGTFDLVSLIDIEVHGTDCYYAYSRVRGSNSYVFVHKYNGTIWTQVGDSVLLGLAGSGGYFDFLLDNNGVPTIAGTKPASGSDKQISQFNGTAWAGVYTIAGSAPAVFQENTAVFDTQNKLYCITSGYVLTPTFRFFSLVHKIDGNTRTNVGDTLFNGITTSNKIRLDANNIPYFCFNLSSVSKAMALKLTGNTWTMMGDTSSAASTGLMNAADVTDDGKVVFYTLHTTTLAKRVHFYDNTSITTMDAVNATGTLAAITDLVIPSGSNDVYVLVHEAKASAASDLSVMKHAVTGGPSGIFTAPRQIISLYPNPAREQFRIELPEKAGQAEVTVSDLQGRIVHRQSFAQLQTLILTTPGIAAGVYLVSVQADGTSFMNKLMIR